MAARDFNSDFNSDFGFFSQGYLQLAVPIPGKNQSFEDGDIMSAVSWRRCRHMMANGVVFTRDSTRRYARLNQETGFFDTGSVVEDYCLATHALAMVRLNATEGKLVRLSDMAEIPFTTGVPYVQFNGRTVVTHLGPSFERKVRSLQALNGQGQPLFGTNVNNLTMYGGRKDHSHVNIDTVWDAIESKVGVNERDAYANFRPFSNMKTRLAIAVNNMTDQEASDLSGSLLDETDPDNPIIVKKRKNWVQWRDLQDVIEADVLDKNKLLRLDKIRKHIRQSIVQTKSLP